jgi:hypothetical protein
MEGNLNLQEIFKSIPIPKKKPPRKKRIMIEKE